MTTQREGASGAGRANHRAQRREDLIPGASLSRQQEETPGTDTVGGKKRSPVPETALLAGEESRVQPGAGETEDSLLKAAQALRDVEQANANFQ